MNPAADCLARAAWQPEIFAAEPSRAGLARLSPTWERGRVRLQVLRNQPFELIASVLPPFLAFAGWEADVSHGDYDDSLALPAHPGADVELVWLDFDRYRARLGPAAMAAWLSERLAGLGAATGAPILVADWAERGPESEQFNEALRESVTGLPGVHVCPVSEIAGRLGESYRDERMAEIAGTSMSDAACLHLARHLGLAWLPSVLGPPLKAVVVDLDGTLYEGVLGEDGSSGIVISPAHHLVHRRLLSLRERGIYLAIASRNQPDDVERLFSTRTDLLLRPEHLSALEVGWRSKVEAVESVAGRLRVGVDSILLVDDNPGELASVAAALPGVRCLHAADAGDTARALDLFPGLFAFTLGSAAELRAGDLATAPVREALAVGVGEGDYFRSLEIELSFALDPRAQRHRLHELSTRTNQFNTGLTRLSEVQVEHYLRDPERRAVGISLRDRLSDSGMIAAVFAHREEGRLLVDEVAISCRALGRRLETVMIVEAVRGIVADLPADEVRFAFAPGPRDQPAREWLEAAVGPIADGGAAGDFALRLTEIVEAPLSIAWEAAP